jgi:uncharacterized membrane protein HdeD (DUF308 family)
VTLSTVLLGLAVYFVLDGAFEALGSLAMIGEEGWAWMLGAGVLSIVLGVCVWNGWPVSGARAVGLLVGVRLISAGVAMLRVEHTIGRARLVGARLRAG